MNAVETIRNLHVVILTADDHLAKPQDFVTVKKEESADLGQKSKTISHSYSEIDKCLSLAA